MRQLWVSGAILVGMAVLLWANAVYLGEILGPMEEGLSQASQAAERGDDTRALSTTQALKTRWEDHAAYLRLVQCHTCVDEIKILLEEAEAYLIGGDTAAYRAAVARIREMLRGMEEREQVTAENLF